MEGHKKKLCVRDAFIYVRVTLFIFIFFFYGKITVFSFHFGGVKEIVLVAFTPFGNKLYIIWSCIYSMNNELINSSV